MEGGYLLELFFIRHGDTNYTQQYPDLTEKGIKKVRKSAMLIKSAIDIRQPYTIVSSLLTRAVGTADIIAQILGYSKEILIEADLYGVKRYDNKKGWELYQEFFSEGGKSAVDRAYTCDPRYDDKAVFETRAEVRRRFYNFLANTIFNAVSGKSIDKSVIGVSHFEVLYHLPHYLFSLDYSKAEPLQLGEFFIIRVSEYQEPNSVLLEVEFRHMVRDNLLFDYAKGILTEFRDFC